MSLVSGLALLLAGLFVMLASVHFRGLRYFDRPTLARNAYFDRALDLLKWLLVIAGLLLLWRASAAACVAALGALVILWAYRRLVRSVFLQERLLRRDFAALRRTRPEMTDQEILFELACRKHPRWGPELVDQMTRDYPTIEAFARILCRMERGFRGFTGRRPPSR